MKINRRTFFKWLGIGTAVTLTNPGKLVAKIPVDKAGEIILDQMSWVAEEDWGIVTHVGVFVNDQLIQLTPLDYSKTVSQSETVSLSFGKPLTIEHIKGSWTLGLFENNQEVIKKGYRRIKL